MTRILGYLFNIRPNEWPRAIIIYVMGFLFLVGMTWGETVAQASFLSRVGVEVLPYIFVADALITIAAIAIYTLFVDRIANDRLLNYILIAGVVAVAIGRMMIGASTLDLAFPFLYVTARVVKETFNLQWWNYVTGFYDARAAKRLIPILSTSARVAGIFAGLTMPGLTSLLTPANMIILWAVMLVLVMVGAWSMPRLVKDDSTGGDPEAMARQKASAPQTDGKRGQVNSYIKNLREGYQYISQSVFLRWMAISTFALMVLFALMNFATSQILADQLKSQQAITRFLGDLTWSTNLLMLPIQLFVLGRIINRVGLGNANLIFPAGTMIICTPLVLPGPTALVAGLAYFDQTTFRTTVRNIIDNLLYNAVPLRIKGRARAFIGGLVVPLGSLLGGLLLVAMKNVPGLLALSAPLIAFFAIFYMLTAIVVLNQYAKALVRMLEQEEFSFLLSSAADLTVRDKNTFNWLNNKLKESKSGESAVFIAKLMSEIGGEDSVPMLIELAKSSDEHIRASIVDILVAADLRGEELRGFFRKALTDSSGRVRQSAITGLAQCSDPTSEEFLSQALDLLQDPELEVRAQVLPLLIRSDDPFYVASAIQSLTPLLNNDDPRWQARGVQVLSKAKDVRFIRNLMTYLNATDDAVRLEAAVAIEGLVSSNIPRIIVEPLITHMKTLLTDPVERIRQAALIILGRIDPNANAMLIHFLTDRSARVRDTAVEALAQLGKPVLPLLNEQIISKDVQLRKMAAVTVARINPTRSMDLIRGFVQANLQLIYANIIRVMALNMCAEYRGIAILQSVLRERNDQLRDEIFYMLGALHDQKDVRVIAESLASDVARVRANAIEAIESISTPQLARMMYPLFDREMTEQKLLQISKTYADVNGTSADVLRALASDSTDPWPRAIALFALAEIYAPPPPPEKEPASSSIESAMQRAKHLNLREKTDEVARKVAEPKKVEKAANEVNPTPDAPSEPPEPPKAGSQPRARRTPKDLLGGLIGDSTNTKAPTAESADKSNEAPATPKETDSAVDDLLKGPKTAVRKAVLPKDSKEHVASLTDITSSVAAERVPMPPPPQQLSPCQQLFTRSQIEQILTEAETDLSREVTEVLSAAKRMLNGQSIINQFKVEEGIVLSPIEKIIFLREVSFFAGMTIDQLKILASVSEEEIFEEDAMIFKEGDPGGVLYVVVRGRVGIEIPGKRAGSTMRIATVEAYSYFGEMRLFDESRRSERAVALSDTLTLKLRREPLIALTRQYPDLSLKLINVLSQRLREANERIAQLTSVRPHELHKVFDKLDE